MTIELSSQNLSVKINSFGAEICSVKNSAGIEFIWQANKGVWARHAPVLFPIVGKLKDNRFLFEEKWYELPQHGFARDMEFQLISAEKNSCVFQLSSSAETKAKFPFDFIFQIIYHLSDSVLTTTYKIINPSAQTGYFSVGAHPGFNCPLAENETFEDYYLEFESNDFKKTLLDNGLLSSQTSQLNLTNQKLPLSANLFDNDALVFESNQINKISLCSSKSSHKISMECKGWPFFGIWSKKGNNPFVCLEPWYGIADDADTSQNLVSKKGAIAIKPDEEFSCSFSVTFH